MDMFYQDDVPFIEDEGRFRSSNCTEANCCLAMKRELGLLWRSKC